MAREDDILRSFVAHPLLKEEYNLTDYDLPQTVLEGVRSGIPIIQAIATIVKETQRVGTVDADLQRQVFQLLNKKPL